MSMATLEREILRELKEVTGIKKLKQKNIQEWSTTEIKPMDGEKLIKLPTLKIYVAYKEEL